VAAQAGAYAERGVAAQAEACAERGSCALQMLIFMTAELQIRQDERFPELPPREAGTSPPVSETMSRQGTGRLKTPVDGLISDYFFTFAPRNILLVYSLSLFFIYNY
jgi:hypothetical protein